MSYFLIQFENEIYAGSELFCNAVAGGEKAFIKMLAGKAVIGKQLFDQVLYPLTAEQRAKCVEYSPTFQDFDETYRYMNVLSEETIQGIKERKDVGFPGASVVTIPERFAPALYEYRHAKFFRIVDYKEREKYKMVPKLAAVKVCGRIYVAVKAVNVRVEAPIIVTISR